MTFLLFQFTSIITSNTSYEHPCRIALQLKFIIWNVSDFYFPFSPITTTENCHEDWYNHCTQSSDCCSGYCFLGETNNWSEGVCKPSSDAPVSPETTRPSESIKIQCHENWYSHCSQGSDCCSGNCFKGEANNWREGVCKPSPTSDSSSKHPDCRVNWNNECHSNQECCSNICFMGESNNWRNGVCHPANATIVSNCLPLWNNKCQSSVECCSGYCDRPVDWRFGICKSRGIQNITNGKSIQ